VENKKNKLKKNILTLEEIVKTYKKQYKIKKRRKS
jgi:hypothetical protein